MKKIISFVMVMVMILGISVTAFAADGDFVPSINEKPAPAIKSIIVTIDGVEWKCEIDIDGHCVIVTPVSEITEEQRLSDATKQKLIDVYNQIKAAANLSSVFPNIEGVDKMAVRDLFDVSSVCSEFDKVFPGELAKVTITFDLGISADTNIVCASLVNDKWNTHAVKNNGDGSVSVDFTHFCPVAFLVSETEVGNSPATGDNSNLTLWISLLAVSVVAIAAVSIVSIKAKKTNK